MSNRTIIPKSATVRATNLQTRFHTNLASSLNPSPPVESVLPSFNGVLYNHVPLPDEPAGLYDTLLTESDMALTKRKFVKVYSIGELEVEPDLVEFCIKIQSCKADIEQSRESVQKREDYILGVLRKFKVKQDDYSMFTMVKKVDSSHEEDGNENNFTKAEKSRKNLAQQVLTNDKDGDGKKEKLELTREICVKCDSLVKYMHIFSMCNEKLDHHVIVSQPVVRFSPAYVQVNTQKAVNLAMSNGTLKANEIISSFRRRLTLGRLYYSVEDSFKIEEIEDYNNKGMPNNFETFSWRRQNKVFRCNLTSVFELETPKSRRII